jgi:hypothetical protein
MTSRRLLTSVANGIAAAFESRNNDVDGWWAPGLLLGALDDEDYQIDLRSGEASPRMRDELGQLGSAWARYFRWSLERHGLREELVREATLSLSFDRTETKKSRFPDAVEVPLHVSVSLRDDRGRLYTATVDSSCGRLEDFRNPNPYRRPMRSVSRSGDPGRIDGRIAWRIQRAEMEAQVTLNGAE